MTLTARLTQRFRQRIGMNRTSLRSNFNAEKKALVVHGLHKSATMFLFKFFNDVCSQIDVPMYSVHHSPPDHQAIPGEIDRSFVLCPLRSFSIAESSFENVETIHLFQTRDPRDILVSEYYSLGWRHTDQDWDASERERRMRIREMSIDEYVLQEPEVSKYPLLSRYQALLDVVGDSSIHLVKYETMILDFGQWLDGVIPLMGLGDWRQKEYLLDRYRTEFQPDSDPHGHKRNVAPGDHRNRLQAETIERLNERFSAVLDVLEYA